MASAGGSTSREDCANKLECWALEQKTHLWGIRTMHRSAPSCSYPLHCIVIALVVVACPPSSSDLEDGMMKRRAEKDEDYHPQLRIRCVADAVGRMR
ncbi:hypothetical protein BDN70DRAFT_889249 [Pholiota conissans]|uniref:Uncharacterized protein n=1 Tax=Pholiota conissans TaxID=109636 RepID=A0A9P5YK77_9AGAR|nr:hypothetical protein BDN70DRAFT_889249 [Pholiota conissans]